MNSRCVEMRRARPLLGTIVDLHAQADERTTLERAFENAFAAIARVHRLMSFHDAGSDVARINRDAFCRKVIVDPWTWRVLKSAQHFARESNGAFDITVARLLADWNYLPRHDLKIDPAATWRDIALEKNYVVRFRRRLLVDLGGIAKGFAVDLAVAALQKAGLHSGIVNAGGDLRVFGRKKQSVFIRQPVHSRNIAILQNRALATSAPYFTRRRGVSALVNSRTRNAHVDDVSVSVAADDCLTADALTKIVFSLRERARPILAHYRAEAVILERNHRPRCFSS